MSILEFADLAIDAIASNQTALTSLTSGDSGGHLDLKDPKVRNDARFFLTELGMAANSLTRKAGDGKAAGDSAGLYAARSLEYFDPRMFEFELKKTNYRDFIKINNTLPPGTPTYSYEMERLVGKAEPSIDGSTNMTKADIIVEEFSVPIKEDAVFFTITTGDIRRAMLNGRPIEARKARAAYRAAEEIMHQNFLVDGLIGSGYIASDEVVNGVSASPLFVNKTPKEIVVGDIGSLIEAVKVQTYNNHMINILGLPIEQDNLLNLEWISEQFPKPIKQWMLEQLQSYGIKQIIPIPELDGSGVGGTDHMIGWETDNEDVIEGHIPMELRWLPGQINGKTITFVGEFEYSKTVIRRPQAARKAHGI